MSCNKTTPTELGSPSSLLPICRQRELAENRLHEICVGYDHTISSVLLLKSPDAGRVTRSLLLGRHPTTNTSWTDVVTCRILLDTAADQYKEDRHFPTMMFDDQLLVRFFHIKDPRSMIATTVKWKCGRTDEDTLVELCRHALSVIRSESQRDELTPYTPLYKDLERALFGFFGRNTRCLPTFEQLRARWSITLQAYSERTHYETRAKPNKQDFSLWRQRDVSPTSVIPATDQRHISAEECVDATKDVFKAAIESLLQKGFLDVQLGFSAGFDDRAIDLCENVILADVRAVPLKTPSGEVLGYVWHVKGAISRAWQQHYWKRIDKLGFANYPGNGDRVIRIAAKDVRYLFLLGKQNDRVLQSVSLSDLEKEFLAMVSLIMNEQRNIIREYANSRGLLENRNVYWESDMVQTTIGSLATAGYGEHDDLSVLLCDDQVCKDARPTTNLMIRGEDVQTATLVPSDWAGEDGLVSVVWSATVNNRKVELARVDTGPFDIHVQGHLLQKISCHSVLVNLHSERQSDAMKSTRGAMSARFTGPFQKTPKDQENRLKIARAPSKGKSWTLKEHYNRFRVYSEGPFGVKMHSVLTNGEESPSLERKDDEPESDNENDSSPKSCDAIVLPNDRWNVQAMCNNNQEGDVDRNQLNIGINRDTWQILTSAPCMKRLLTEHVSSVVVDFSTSRGPNSRLVHMRITFGLLLDSKKIPVSPGKTFMAREVFHDTGLLNVTYQHQTWSHNPDHISDIILWANYRNDPNLADICERAKRNHTVEETFWISGNGGGASYAGQFAQTGYASRDANSDAPAAKLPGGQRLNAGAGALLEATTRNGVFRVFVRDFGTMDEGLSQSEQQVVYLGLFHVKEVILKKDEQETVIADSKRLGLTVSEQQYILFRLYKHYKFYLEPLTPVKMDQDHPWHTVQTSNKEARFITIPYTMSKTDSINQLLCLDNSCRVTLDDVLDYFIVSEEWKMFLMEDIADHHNEDECLPQVKEKLVGTVPNLPALIDACLGTSVGMFSRVLKENINTEVGSVVPLNVDHYEKHLGRVVCERASPFPCRTLDTTTLYIVLSFHTWMKRSDATANGDRFSFDVRRRCPLQSFEKEDVGDLVFGIIFCRCTGRVNALHEYAKHANAQIGVTQHHTQRETPFLPSLSDLDLLLSFLQRTSIGRKSATLASSWTSSQFALPKAFRYLAPFKEFLRSIAGSAILVAQDLIQIACRATKRHDGEPRNEAIRAIKGLVDATLEKEDRERTLFFAAQVIADFEELWDKPFGVTNLVHPGSGACWFLGAYRRGLPDVERLTKVTTDTMICDSIVALLAERSNLELACLGMYVDGVGQLRHKLNHRMICATDGEHMCCKGTIRITRTFPAYRMSAKIAAAKPSFHPVRYDPGWPLELYKIARDGIEAFDDMVRDQLWPVLADMYVTETEKRMRRCRRSMCGSNDDGSRDEENSDKGDEPFVSVNDAPDSTLECWGGAIGSKRKHITIQEEV